MRIVAVVAIVLALGLGAVKAAHVASHGFAHAVASQAARVNA